MHYFSYLLRILRSKLRCAIIIISTIIIIGSVGCDDSHSIKKESSPLYVDMITKQSDKSGTVISIYGQGFGIQGTEDAVYLTRQKLSVLFWSNQVIEVFIPSSFATGYYYLVIYADGFYSEAIEITISQ